MEDKEGDGQMGGYGDDLASRREGDGPCTSHLGVNKREEEEGFGVLRTNQKINKTTKKSLI